MLTRSRSGITNEMVRKDLVIDQGMLRDLGVDVTLYPNIICKQSCYMSVIHIAEHDFEIWKICQSVDSPHDGSNTLTRMMHRVLEQDSCRRGLLYPS